MEIKLPLDILPPEDIVVDYLNNKRTAKVAANLIQLQLRNCYEPTAQERNLICIEFARAGKPVYGRAFDLYQFESDIARGEESITKSISAGKLKLLEVKSTNRKGVNDDLKGYFFSLSTAELLVAQALGDLYQFAFFNTSSKNLQLMTLADIYKRARGVYPTWSIKF